MSRFVLCSSAAVVFLACVLAAFAQQAAVSAPAIVPPMVSFSGVARDVGGKPLSGMVGITFSLYKEAEGGAPLWLETQSVQLDQNGHYSVMLGSNKKGGIDADLFASGEARWLGVEVQGQPEQSRILLLSVPYALKAADAETLGGKPASAYLLGPQQTNTVPNGARSESTPTTSAPAANKNAALASIAGSGTTGYIPRWTSSTGLGNSIVFQSTASKLGIGTTSPAATIDIHEPTGIRATASGNGVAVYGNATVASGTGKGVEGDTSSTSGTAVAGVATATTGSTQGALGWSYSTAGTGVQGQAKATSGATFGVEGTVFSSSGVGVQGDGNGIGVEGVTSSTTGTAGVFNNTGSGKILSGQLNGSEVFSVNGSGVAQVGVQSTTPTGILNAVSPSGTYSGLVAVGWPPCCETASNGEITDGINATGGSAGATGQLAGAGIVGTGGEGDAMSAAGGPGVVGYAGGGSSGGAAGVEGYGTSGFSGSPGVFGLGGTGFSGADGVDATGGDSNDSTGRSGDGIFAQVGTGSVSFPAYAGDFTGDINVTGAVFAGTKDFKIDHPLDPANKYLLHASIESSEMLDMYSGNTGLDNRGEATVVLPDWFETLNSDFRYQLTSVGAPSPNLYIGERIAGNRFKIAGGTPGATVSWQITAVRHDVYAKAYPLVVEQIKNPEERGHYIHPELYGAAKERGIAWARHPAVMRHLTKHRTIHAVKKVEVVSSNPNRKAASTRQ